MLGQECFHNTKHQCKLKNNKILKTKIKKRTFQWERRIKKSVKQNVRFDLLVQESLQIEVNNRQSVTDSVHFASSLKFAIKRGTRRDFGDC